ncbi:MAG: hypothetical protein ACJ8E3_08105, partial [Sphingomicrobium sp.]
MAQRNPPLAAADSRDFEVYKSLREYEEHFNRTQVEVKKLASAWMLASFAAIAFIVRGDLSAKNTLLDSGSLLVVIGLGGNIGLLSLWLLDQLVNQRLLGSAFRVGLLLERSNPTFPPIRSKMWLSAKAHGVGRHHSFFYACPMAFNTSAAAYGLAQMSRGQFWWLAVGVAGAAAAFLWPFIQWLVDSFET